MRGLPATVAVGGAATLALGLTACGGSSSQQQDAV